MNMANSKKDILYEKATKRLKRLKDSYFKANYGSYTEVSLISLFICVEITRCSMMSYFYKTSSLKNIIGHI